MHGTGNDFVVVDNRDGKLRKEEVANFARRVCQRKFSVGADGLILVYNSDVADAKMQMFNPDGTEAEMCGNGIRCFAKFCYDNSIARREKLNVETLAGIKQTQLSTRNGKVESVEVNMGKPSFERKLIPMIGEGKCINEKLRVSGKTYEVTCLSLGNPHCVIFVDDLETLAVQEIGSTIETHELFPHRANVEFVQVANRKELSVRVWERGAGETLSCGTGACASAVAGYVLGKTERNVTAHLSGGDLGITYDDDSVFMRGSAVKVFSGELLWTGE
jgi:diaminopimelate epimerase